MGWQVISQGEADPPLVLEGEMLEPGGYCIRSSVTGSVIAWNLDRADVVALHVESAARRAARGAMRVLEKLDAGEPPYHQFTRTWDDIVAEERERQTEEDGWVARRAGNLGGGDGRPA